MNVPVQQATPSTENLSIIDRTRIWWAAKRYDFWLDLRFVPRKRRKDLALELRSNLSAASGRHGVDEAMKRVGSLRSLAAAATTDDAKHVRWNAGATMAVTALAFSAVVFLMLSFYYTEGVLDSGTTERVSSGLFPFFGSKITVNPPQSNASSFSFEMSTGPLPLVLAAATFVTVARPWRAIRRHPAGGATSIDATP